MQSSSYLPCASMSTLGLLSCRGAGNDSCSASGATMKTSPICASPGSGSLSCSSSSIAETNLLHTRGAARWSDAYTSRSSSRSRRRWRASIAEQELAQKAKYEQDAKVIQIHTVKQFEEAVAGAGSKLVVVEYAASTSPNSRRIYPSMVELSLTCQDAVFLLVMGDESGETGELCRRAGVQKVPHFVFYKGGEVVHEEEGMSGGPDQLLGDVLYYGGGGADNPIAQLHSKKELEDLVRLHASDGKLLVLDVGLKHCGPCVKVYPTFVKLAKKMRETAVFARINGDESDELMELLRQMDVVEVPTFVFIRDGSVRGRYVGSGKGELIGEILRHQGVRVTY